jgi:hypothetical protein
MNLRAKYRFHSAATISFIFNSSPLEKLHNDKKKVKLSLSEAVIEDFFIILISEHVN